jgi:endoglucanase
MSSTSPAAASTPAPVPGAPPTVVDGQLCANVPGSIPNRYDAGIGVNGLKLRNGGTYTLSFDAKATVARSMNANVQIDGPPFAASLSATPELGPTTAHYTYTFTWSQPTANAGLAFQVGYADAWTVCVDNVSLVGPPAPAEQIVNGSFATDTNGWWSTGNAPLSLVDGAGCATVTEATTNPWDVIIGQDNLTLIAGESYAFTFKAKASSDHVVKAIIQEPLPPSFPTQIVETPTATPTWQTFSFGFTATSSLTNAQLVFQIGGGAGGWTLCLDDVSLTGGAAPPVYTPDTGPRVRVNQVAYLPKGPKNATLVTDATTPLAWQLHNGSGATVASGQSTPRGMDASSGQNVHSIDFSSYTTAGTGFTLVADGETSHPFDLDSSAYEKLRADALKFYYTQRSGTAILESLRPGYGRPAGHVGVAPNQGDTLVPCQPGVCDYSLNVAGGWYDAGDHGKYVVNGGISAYQLMSEYERTKVAPTAKPAKLGDSTLAIPESGNGVPDVLDEARWELEFMLSMQVPTGKPLAGMAHHKIHDENWTGLPLLPHVDPQKRELHAPSTAATLNLAATAAQCGRLYASYDRAFAARCLSAARIAWAAAVAHPAIYASPNDGVGGGTYDDDNVTDEFYWAAAELYLTTGEKAFADYVTASPLHTADVFRAEGFDWKYVATAGRLDLALIPNNLPSRPAVRASVLAGAQKYLDTIAAHPYGLPYAPTSGKFDWGSNNLALNNMVVLATAYDISGTAKYRDGVLQGFNYLLGRNALNQSYVTGYGENASRNQHSRWYARQLNPALPNPPVGSLSGGPNSSIQDPKAQAKLQGCLPQFCYIDDIESWSTNELTINWNSTLAWVTAFVADQGDAAAPPPSTCRVRYDAVRLPIGVYAATVKVTNTGSSTVDGWTLGWAFIGGDRVVLPIGASASQAGPWVSARNVALNKRIRPGDSVTFAVLGSNAGPFDPGLFSLNGRPCTA